MDSPSKYSVIFWFGILFLRIALVLPYSQPWPIKVESIGRCCGSVQTLPISVYDYNGTEVEKLKRCLNLHGHTIGRVPVSIISYASPGTGDFAIPDIEQFSVYQRAVVAAYAENNRYSFVHMDENIDLSKFEGTLDSRWFKIKLLLDALNTYARDAQYLVWLDADAVILDFGLLIEELGAKYPRADLLASADIRMGLINTGVLVLRNTPWLQQFLHYWWYGPPIGPSGIHWRSVCDQDAFDRLYSYYASLETGTGTATPSNFATATRISEKVKVLPMDALNSHPPAMLHQQAHSPVLHLMGEATAMRRELFRLAWSTSICGARSGGVLPPQLGLNRDVILSFARIVYGEGVSKLLEGVRSVSKRSIGSMGSDATHLEAMLVAPLTELSTAAHHLCDILHHLHQQEQSRHQQQQQRRRLTPQEAQSAEKKRVRYQKEQLALRTEVLELVLARVAQVKAEISLLGASAQHTEPEREPEPVWGSTERRKSALLVVLVQLIKRAAEAGNDVFGAAVLVSDKMRAAGTIFDLLEELASLVDEDSKFVPKHMQALMHQNLGLLEHNLALSIAATASTAHTTTGTANEEKAWSPDGGGGALDTKSLVDSHLQEAAKHLAASVAIFKDNKRAVGAAAAQDSATLMEESLSLQLLAGVTCSLGRYREGVRLWVSAVEQARHSLLGLQLGVRYDNLANVLYNAAVCNHAAHKDQQADALVTEAVNMLSTSSSSSTKGRQGDAETEEGSATDTHSTLLRAARELKATLASATQTGSSVVSAVEKGTTALKQSPPLVMRAVASSGSGSADGPKTYVRHSAGAAPAQKGGEGEGEEEEWVECELDEDCEYFDVLEEEEAKVMETGATAALPTTSTFPPPAASTSTLPYQVTDSSSNDARKVAAVVPKKVVDVLAGVDVEGMSPEEVAELREVRTRYTRQTAAQAAVVPKKVVDVLNVLAGVDVEGMSPEEVAELREVCTRYTRQTAAQAAVVPKKVVDVLNVLAGVDVEGMSPEEVVELREVCTKYTRQTAVQPTQTSASAAAQRLNQASAETEKLQGQRLQRGGAGIVLELDADAPGVASIEKHQQELIWGADVTAAQEEIENLLRRNNDGADFSALTLGQNEHLSQHLRAMKEGLQLQQEVILRLDQQVRTLQQENRELQMHIATRCGEPSSSSTADSIISRI